MALIVEIASVDHTADVYRPENGDVFTIDYALQGDWECEITTHDTDSTASAYRPAIDQALAIRNGTTVWFHGQIMDVWDEPMAGTGTGVLAKLRAKSYGSLLVDEANLDESFASGQTLKQVVTVLHTNYLNGFGIGIDATMASGPTLEAQVFKDCTLRDAFDHLSTVTGYVWRIIPSFGSFGELQFFSVTTKTSPYATLSAANGLSVGPIKHNKKRSYYANRIVLRYGEAQQLSKTDTFTGTAAAGETNFNLTYTPIEVGSNIVSDGYVTEAGVFYPLGSAVGGVTWSYDSANNRLQRSSDLGTGVVATFRYSVQFPQTVTVSDSAAIASYGRTVTRKFMDRHINDYAKALEEANGLLRRYLAAPKSVDIATRQQSVAFPGDAITLTFANRVVSGSHLIEKTSYRPFNMEKEIETKLTCAEGGEHQEDWIDRFRDILGGGTGVSGLTTEVSGGVLGVTDGRFQGDVIANTGQHSTGGSPCELALTNYIDTSVEGPTIRLGRIDKAFTWLVTADTNHGASGNSQRLAFKPYLAGLSAPPALLLASSITSPDYLSYWLTPGGSTILLNLGDRLGQAVSPLPINSLYLSLTGGPEATPGVGASGVAAAFSSAFAEAGSGTHPQFATVTIGAPTITAGAAALTEAVSLYIAGAPSGGTANAALRINSGALVLGPASAGFGNQFILNNAEPTMDFYESDQAADGKFWRWIASGGIFSLQKLTDAYGSATTLFQTDRSGNAYLVNLEIAGFQQYDEQSSNPSAPTAGSAVRVYMKADKFIIYYNDGGTSRWYYLDLPSTSGTWTHTTSAP